MSHNVYENIGEWISDIELVFFNCKKYNGIQSEVGQIGMKCQEEFNRLIEIYGIKERFSTGDKNANGHKAGEDLAASTS